MSSAPETIAFRDRARRAVRGTCPPTGWARPATKGELRDRLNDGETCEVATMAAEMAAIGLRGWLDFDWFTTRPSDNDGWTLFEPNAEVKTPH